MATKVRKALNNTLERAAKAGKTKCRVPVYENEVGILEMEGLEISVSKHKSFSKKAPLMVKVSWESGKDTGMARKLMMYTQKYRRRYNAWKSYAVDRPYIITDDDSDFDDVAEDTEEV